MNQFRDNLKDIVEQIINRHEPLKVTQRSGEEIVVLIAKDWEREREQETLHVLLQHNLSGLFSKWISQKDRLIYRFDAKSIYIFAIGGHYDQS